MKLYIKKPRENGLYTDEECVILNQIDRLFSDFIQQNDGFYVGRITGKSKQFYYAYVDLGENQLIGFIQKIKNTFGYELDADIQGDEKRAYYHELLFPSEADWRWILDSKVIRNLIENGDDLSQARRIDHFVYFNLIEDAEKFKSWATQEGYKVEGISKSEEETPRFLVNLFHEAIPQFVDMNVYTIQLMEKAKEMSGEYDGWETFVVRPPQTWLNKIKTFFRK